MSSFLHSQAWARFQQAAGAEVAWHDHFLFIRRQIPGGSYWLSSRSQLASLPPFVSGSCFLRLEPADQAGLEELRRLAQREGHRLLPTLAHQPRQTLILDLEQAYEEILQGMKQKHRYNLRLAQRHDLEYEVCPTYDEGAFERFWRLHSDTASRQDFRTHPKEYYRQMLQTLCPEGMASLHFVSRQGEELAALLLITYQGTATYLHGASSPRQRELMAPYLLHWQAMHYAKEQGLSQYDFWGTDLAYNAERQEWQAKEGQRSAGTSRFKLGFGGRVVEYPGAYDLILNPFCYTLYATIRRLRHRRQAFR